MHWRLRDMPSFAVTAQESGTLAMTFTDDHGVVQTETVSVTVE